VTEQPASGTVVGNTGAHGLDAQTAQTWEHEEYHGRRVSWVAVTLIIVGFIIGGIALPIGPSWVLFWVGAAIVVIGVIFAASIRIMDDWY
jgi:nitrate/nitrite transporter NarK